jgi:predicted O-methyltransferase YrrM
VIPFFQIKSYIQHWLHVVNEHSIHSPFFFDFYEKVIRTKKNHTGFEDIERIRGKLLESTMEIDVQDLGASSSYFTNEKRTLSKVVATSISPTKVCAFLYRIVHYQQATAIVELGTSAGITTLYLAKNPGSQVTTFEGHSVMSDIALTNFESLETKNIKLIQGNIDTALPNFLQSPTKINFVLMDANHRYEPTIRYFQMLSRRMAEKGIIVVDDINHSKEMARAWNELRHHDLVYGSVDLFRCGILFFDPALNRQHYTWAL